MEKQINIKLEGEVTKPIVILEGEAPKPINLSPVSISGRFDSVSNYWKERELFIDKQKTYLTIDIDSGIMILVVNEGHPHATTITAKVERAKLLGKLKIETDSRFSNKELSQVLRTNGILFSDKQKHSDLLSQLNKFIVKANVELQSLDDNRGNAKESIEAKLEHDIPKSFTLNTPIIQGGEPKKFEVNICMEVRDKGISFWLESPEMEELFREQTEQLLNIEAKKISGIPIIFK